jgi:BRCT domain type II-containing protein
MIEALRNPPKALKAGVRKTLKGVHLAFTGILSKPRRDAVRAAKRAGAIVHGMPSIKTSVVVRGRPNAQQAAGKEAGLKLMEIKRLRGKGHRITLLEEAQFWRLARRQ